MHCTIALEQAKCFAGKEKKFYNPNKPKAVKVADEATLEMIQGIHRNYDHASHNELERLFHCVPNEFVGITLQDLKKWKEMSAIKEHPKYKSTKHLVSDVPMVKSM